MNQRQHPDDPSLRARRLRQMNEQVRQRRDEFDGGAAASHAIMCECADPACAEMLQVQVSELDTVRADDDLFLVAPAHVGELPVVEHGPAHVVVRLPEA